MDDTDNAAEVHGPKREKSRSSARAAAVVAASAAAGAAAGALTYLTAHSIPQAVLTAGAAAGGAGRLLQEILGGNKPEIDDCDDQSDTSR